MQAYDLIMLIVLAATTIFGAIKGFAWQLASLASIVVSYFVAYFFRNDVAKMINAQPPWNLFLAMLLLYFGSSLIIWLSFRMVSGSIDKVKLKDFDRQLGAGFGLIKGMALCLLITMFAMTLLGSAQQQRIANSKSGLYITRILASADGVLPAELKQIVGPYIDNVERRLQQGQSGVGMPAGPGPLDGLGQMIQQQVDQFGNRINNGVSNGQTQPGGFFTGAGQGGPSSGLGQGGQGAGGFFGQGQGTPPDPAGPWGMQNNPGNPNSPPNGNGWPNGFGGNEVLPR
jgi:membrane protein required for colicin V production